MATIGSISIGMELLKSKFDGQIAQVQTKTANLSTGLKALSEDLVKVGSGADTLATKLNANAWPRWAKAAAFAGNAAKEASKSITFVAQAADTANLAIEALTVGMTISQGVFHVLGAAAYVVLTPFRLVYAVTMKMVAIFRTAATAIGSLFTPFGRIVAMLRLYVAIGRAAIVVTRAANTAVKILSHALNPLKLAGDLAALSLRGVAFAGKQVVRSIGPIKSVLGGALQTATTAAIGLAGALAFTAISAAGTIDAAGDMADKLGTTTAALQSLRYAATLTGSSGEQLDGALEKLSVNLGKAATEGGPAADALARIGLDAKKLAVLDPTETFVQISGALQQVKTPAEQAALAMELFGKGGLGVLTTLKAGPAEIQRLSKEFAGFGGAVSESQRAAVGAMFDSFDKIKALITGVGASIAVKLQPYVLALTDGIIGLATASGDIGPTIDAAIGGIGTALEYVGHAIDFAQLGWFGFKSNGLSALAVVARAVASLGEAFASLINLIPGMDVQLGSTARLMGDELDRLAQEAHQSGQKILASQGFGQKFRSAFDSIKTGAMEAKPAMDAATRSALALAEASETNGSKITELIAKLREEKAMYGLSADAAEIYKLKQLGAGQATINEAQAIHAEIAAMDARKKQLEKDAEDAKKIVEEIKSPFEKLREELARINELQKQGFLTAKDAATAALKAKGEVIKGQGEGGAKFAGAVELGSKEARSAVLAHQTRTGRDPMTEVVQISREQLAVSRRGVKAQEKLSNDLNKTREISLAM